MTSLWSLDGCGRGLRKVMSVCSRNGNSLSHVEILRGFKIKGGTDLYHYKVVVYTHKRNTKKSTFHNR